MSTTGVELTREPEGRQPEVLTHEALAFVAGLHRAFDGRRRELLTARGQRRTRLASGERMDFLAETREVREGDWQVAPPPPDLRDRRVEITGPVDRKMVINALNSGARGFMADFEDSLSPTWANVVDGHVNLIDAIDRHDRVHRPRRARVPPRRARPPRCSCARAAGTCTTSTC